MARKILLADDSVTAQNMGRKILADAGYDVVTVNNGSAALKKIAELKPELVILDVYMPGYSGLEVCQRLKETPDSSRLPVLLTVGKLEPFKPEEAQRVRADGYIVKPFEASELLSALTKLEDKIVPRAEPSKPGRFARAIASVEEANRNSQQIVGGDDNGWKNRIGFPQEKAEEEKPADDAALYNPVNRDLRTVVETPAEKIEEKIAENIKIEDQPRQQESSAESVDLAAVAPQGVPQDVTPEEVAAIAAAAAQIQTLQAVLQERDALEAARQNVPEPSIEAQSAPVQSVEQAPQPVPEIENVAAVSAVVETAAVEKIESPAPEIAVSEPVAVSAEETPEAPVTMAAAASQGDGGTRWSAVSVALQGDEAAISLEQEMQRAYAAFVAEEKASAASEPSAQSLVEPVATASAEQFGSVTPEAALEATPQAAFETASISIAQDAPAAEVVAASPSQEAALPTVDAAEWYSQPAEISASTEAPAPEAQIPQYQISETQTPENQESVAVVAVVAAVTEEPRDLIAQSVQPAPEVVAEPSSYAAVQETYVEAPSEPAAETSASSRAFAVVALRQDKAEPEESETVKTTAAAWASWRQVRDAGERNTSTAEASAQDFDSPAPPDSAAMAVAAGAEQIAHEAALPAGETPADVASIVDSVLADLRPRLMAEITRKMTEKK